MMKKVNNVRRTYRRQFGNRYIEDRDIKASHRFTSSMPVVDGRRFGVTGFDRIFLDEIK